MGEPAQVFPGETGMSEESRAPNGGPQASGLTGGPQTGGPQTGGEGGRHSHAIVFGNEKGGTGKTFLVIDANGTAGFQASGDLVIELVGAKHLSSLDIGDFF